jgi:hypothetical protein
MCVMITESEGVKKVSKCVVCDTYDMKGMWKCECDALNISSAKMCWKCQKPK